MSRSSTLGAKTEEFGTSREDLIRIKALVNTLAVWTVGKRHVCGVVCGVVIEMLVEVCLGNLDVVGVVDGPFSLQLRQRQGAQGVVD